MRTEDLINDLAERLTPVPPLWMERRLAGWTLIGALLSAGVMLGWLGLRPDLAAASLTGMFWVKFAYVLGLSLAGAGAALSLGRPGGRGTRGFALAFGLVAVLALVAAVSSLSAPVEARHRMMMGHSARLCPWFILAMSLPVLGSALIALRGMAPTRPALAGAAAGLLAGGTGAFVYAFYCNESAAPFIVLWYTAGIGASGLLGAILGRWTLRW